jgi:coenzyme F420-reducing hydrogenase beta subunit
MNRIDSTPSLLPRVLNSELCVGCGLCAGLSSAVLQMNVTPRGEYQPSLRDGHTWTEVPASVQEVCPFSGAGPDEDALGKDEFDGRPGMNHSPQLGYYLRTEAAWVTDDAKRVGSSAGGLGTWIVHHLLENRIVDGVFCVTESATDQALFEYRLVRDPAELAASRKSKYYPVEMSKILEELVNTEGRFAIVALPCFAKGLRLAMRAGLVPKEKIHCIIGLFCGHLKTRQFAHYLIRSCGLHEKDTVAVDFRKKVLDDRASEYAFEARASRPDGTIESRQVRMRDVRFGNWGLNGFMLKACECCDDVVAELADISLGDAWLPEFVQDGRGTNLIITRRADLATIIAQGVASGELAVKPVSAAAVIASQDGGFRQRRQGLAYRLHLARQKGEWRPAKRVKPDGHSLKLYSRLIQHLRIRIAEATKAQFLRYQADQGLSRFQRSMRWWLLLHNTLFRSRKWLMRPGRRT